MPPDSLAPPAFLTTEEVAHLCRCSAATVLRWRHRRGSTFPRPVKVGRRLLFNAAEVNAYLEGRREGALAGGTQ